jgi:hypothetical protein
MKNPVYFINTGQVKTWLLFIPIAVGIDVLIKNVADVLRHAVSNA